MQWEISILDALQEIHTPWLDEVMIFITNLGNSAVYNIWIIAGVVFLFFKKTRRMGLQLLISMLCTFLIGNLGIKEWVARPRPYEANKEILDLLLISTPGEFSFPSGHSMNSLSAALGIYFNNKKIGIPAIILAVLIGLSRLYHYVHYPTDVLGGFAFAIIVAFLVNQVFKLVTKKIQTKKQVA